MRKTLACILALALVCALLIPLGACAAPQVGWGLETPLEEQATGVYGDWQNSDGLLEEQLMRGSGTGLDARSASSGMGTESSGSGVSGAGREAAEGSEGSRFRNTADGEPLVIHEFINRVLIDNERVKITLFAKTADALGDAGFTLIVENRYRPLTPVGYDNYCYITPIMGTWTVDGVKMDPKTEGQIFPAEGGTIYLYFDELSSVDELVEVEGAFEIYLISDWWNPIDVYAFEQE